MFPVFLESPVPFRPLNSALTYELIDHAMNAGVFIDDAGTPGVESRSEFLHKDRKSWAAVLVPDKAATNLEIALKMFLAGIQSDYGADELHFTDIYSGRREFKGVPTYERFRLFDLMAGIFQQFKLPIIYQTSSPEFLQEARNNFNMKENFGSLNLNRHEHFSLAILLFQVRDFVAAHPQYFSLMKAGTEIKFDIWQDHFSEGQVAFQSSSCIPFLQLADFAAFSISRTQWLAGRGDLNDRDIEFMRIVSADRFQLINLPLAALDPNKHKTEDYDEMQRESRVQKGLPREPPKNG